MHRLSNLLATWVTLGLWLGACAPQPTPLPTFTPTATRPVATQTPTTLPTHTPQPTATPSPIPVTPTHTPIPTADRSLPLSENGIWLAYMMSSYSTHTGQAAVVNADGGGLQRLESNAYSISSDPTGPFLAVLSQSPGFTAVDFGADTLEIVHLPDMSVKTIPLAASPAIASFDYSQLDYHYPIQNVQQALVLIVLAASYHPPAWSLDGRYLAFTAAIDGPTTDLYVYDTRNDQIRRLSEGPEMATQPEWSPDGKWIVYRGIESFGAGCTETSVWAAALDGSQNKWLNPGECFTITRWIGSETFDTFTPPGNSAASDGPVKQINIATGKVTTLGIKPIAAPVIDCLTQATPTGYAVNDSNRIASPDGKWFAVANDRLRVYAADGSLVEEFDDLDQFLGWQPGTNAAVFTSGGRADRRMLQVFQPKGKILKTYPDSLPAAGTFPDQVTWDTGTANFFLLLSSTQELLYIDPLAGQFHRVDTLAGDVFGWHAAWVGAGVPQALPLQVPCFARQP